MSTAMEPLDAIAAAMSAAGTFDALRPGVLGPLARACVGRLLDPPPSPADPVPASPASPAAGLAMSCRPSMPASAGILRFAGQARLFPRSCGPVAAAVEGWLVDGPEAAGGDGRRLVLVMRALDDLRLEDLLSRCGGPAASGQFLLWDGSPLMASTALADATLVFSSVPLPVPRDSAWALPDGLETALDGRRISAGLNFNVAATLADDPAAAFAMLKLPARWSAGAVIGLGAPGPALTLSIDGLATSATLPGLDMRLERADFGLVLAPPAAASVSIRGALSLGGVAAAMAVDFDVVSRALRIRTTAAVDLPSPAALAGLLGLADIARAYLPGDGSEHGIYTLENLSLEFDIDPFFFGAATFDLSTQHPVSLLADIVSVRPLLSVQITSPLDRDWRDERVSLVGTWMLGGTALDTRLSLRDQTLDAEMALGQKLDLAALLDAVIPGVALPSHAIELLDLSLSADWGAKTFEAEIDVASDWAFDVAGASLVARDLSLQVSYAEGRVTDCEMSGRLSVAGLELEAQALYDGAGWVLRASTVPDSRLSLTEVADELARDLGGIGVDLSLVPGGLLSADVALKDLFLEHATAGTGRTLFYGSLDHAFTVTPGFAIDTVFVRMEASRDGLSVQARAMLTVAGVTLFIEAERNPAGWRFRGGTAVGSAVPVGALLADAADKFGLSGAVPSGLDGLALSDLAVAFDSEGSFSVGGTLAAGAGAPNLGRLVGTGDASSMPNLPAAAVRVEHQGARDGVAARTRIAVALTGGWTLGPFKLDELSVLFEETEAAVSVPAASPAPPAAAQVSATVEGRLTLGGVALAAVLVYSGGAWTLDASASAGDAGLSPGRLFDDLTERCGFRIPDFLRDAVTLDSLALHHAAPAGSSPERTSLSLSGRLSLGSGAPFDVTLDSVGSVTTLDGHLFLGGSPLRLEENGGRLSARWPASDPTSAPSAPAMDVGVLTGIFGFPDVKGVVVTSIDLAYTPVLPT